MNFFRKLYRFVDTIIVEKPWGREYKCKIPFKEAVVFKTLIFKKGEGTSEHSHDKKEILILSAGEAWIWLTHKDPKIGWHHIALKIGVAVFIEPGQLHRIEAIEDCVLSEVSTAEIGTTHRHKDKYGRGDESEEDRKKLQGVDEL